MPIIVSLFSSNFLPEWQGGMSRAEQRVIIFQLYFALEGETQTPWRDDVDFLSALLELYSKVFAHCPYEHYVTISDNSIVVTFRNLSVEMETDDLLPYIDSFMLQLQHFLPEIVVQNPENPWDIFQSPYSQYDLTEGIFIANPLESVWLRLQDLTSSSSSLVPGRVYKQREGSKLLPDYIPHSGNIDKSNKKCVLYSLCYALDILGINNLDEKQVWNVYLGLIGRKKAKGVVIDANYTKWLSTYVDLTPVFRKDYASHIRDGEPVIAFLPMDRTDPHNLNLHCVVIVGYNMHDEWLTYYNPTTGELHEAPSSDFIRQDVSYGLKKKERN